MKDFINKLKQNKKLSILTLSLLVVIGVSLAYIIPQLMDGAFGNANIVADSVDRLNFEVTKDISLSVNQFTLAPNEPTLSDTSVATASLLANSTNRSATYNYYVYFNIYNNPFIYTKDENTPEIVLTITDPNGNEITKIDGLKYVTAFDGTKGFDITTYEGIIKVAEQYAIASDSSTVATIQEWTFKVSFINLDTNQTDNTEKVLFGKIIIQQDEYVPTLADVCTGQNMATCFKDNYQLDSTLLYHDENLTNGANDLSYRYSGGDHEPFGSCVYQGNDVYNYLTYELNYSTYDECQKIYKATHSEGIDYIDASFEEDYYNEPVNVEWDTTNSICKTVNTGIEVWYWNGDAVLQEDCNGSAYQLRDYDEYYVGIEYVGAGNYTELYPESRVNNFVCFGIEASPCPVDNLYRIIGIFDDGTGTYRVKLIKYDYATSVQLGTDGDYSTDTFSTSSEGIYQGTQTTINTYSWNYKNDTTINNGLGSNIWSTSLLNKTNLNTNYTNNLGSEWTSKIAETTWQVGGNIWANIGLVTPTVAYQNEITNPATNTTYTSKIGLMYVSDYGFAASQDSWILPFYASSLRDYRTVIQNNWMYMGLNEWTIAPTSSGSHYVFRVSNYGSLYYNVANTGFAVRPVLYLESSVYVMDGDGSMSDPYIIAKD